MAKKAYSKPMLKSEAFVPQSYVAACGETNKVYKFTCDAPAGTLYYFPLKPASGAQPSIGDKSWYSEIGDYHPCSKVHEAETKSGFYWGFVDYDNSDSYSSENELVIVWKGKYGLNGHATQKLDMTKWETAKS